VQSFRGRRRRRGLPVNAEINITNLVDVAFVLLIIFMITAPILQGGVELTLPEADAGVLQAGDGVIVSVTSNGQVYIGEVAVSMEEFPAQFRAQVATDGPRKTVFLKGDREMIWGRGMEVLGIMKSLDVAEVSIVVEPANARMRRM
jgi:biopolymer transport protein TolR